MTIALIFLILGCVGVLFAVISILGLKKVKYGNKAMVLGAAVLTILLFIGTLVNAIIELSRDYDFDETYPCGWVALGLGCGTIAVGVISLLLLFIAIKAKPKEDEIEDMLPGSEDRAVINENFVLLSTSANIGIGLWTSICVSCASIFGVESKNYTKKMNKATALVKSKLLVQMKKYPDFVFADFRIVRDSGLAYTGTVIGTKK